MKFEGSKVRVTIISLLAIISIILITLYLIRFPDVFVTTTINGLIVAVVIFIASWQIHRNLKSV